MIYMLEDWSFFKAFRVLPSPGGRLDQPARFIEAGGIIEGELGRLALLDTEGGT